MHALSRRLLIQTSLALALLGPGVAVAQQPPSPTELRLGLVGNWTGALGYRDYQSDELFEIPVTINVTSPGDGRTLIQQSVFDDGPGDPVWVTTVTLEDPEASTLTSASFRAGREVGVSIETVHLARYVGPTRWTLIDEQIGSDDDAPAEIRVTTTREDDYVESVKVVRPVGADDSAWRFRNQIRLTRVGD
ncbi:MAG: hypothetical protein KKF88_03250 [Alphaproteobacteria bacterium]|nr:hypothetical protein [Alphaproteobacteria bacterium]